MTSPATDPSAEAPTRGQSRPLVVYFHRYPPETETVQYPALRRMLDNLLTRYDVIYFSMRTPGKVDSTLRQGVRTIQFPFSVDQRNAIDKWAKTILYYLFLPWAMRQLRREAPAFIICKETLPFVPCVVGRLGVPMLIATSDWWWSILLGGTTWGRKVAGRLERSEVTRWNKMTKAWVVSTTQAEARVVVRKGMSPERVRVINAPSAPSVFGPAAGDVERTKCGFTSQHWVVAIHGIIRPGKGYGQLLEWWRQLNVIHPPWRLLIIGGAGGESWCRQQIADLGIGGSVVMTGWLPTKQDVNGYLNAGDCLLVIRRNSEDNEGIIPSALFNSMATGKPTVATGLPGMAEIIHHGVDGYLFEPDSFESFRQVLEFVSKHPQEATIAGQAGRERAKQCFDPEVAAAKHCALIDEVLGTDHVGGDANG